VLNNECKPKSLDTTPCEKLASTSVAKFTEWDSSHRHSMCNTLQNQPLSVALITPQQCSCVKLPILSYSKLHIRTDFARRSVCHSSPGMKSWSRKKRSCLHPCSLPNGWNSLPMTTRLSLSSSSSFNSLKANTEQVQVQAVACDNRNARLENSSYIGPGLEVIQTVKHKTQGTQSIKLDNQTCIHFNGVLR